MEILELCSKLKEKRKELGYSIEEVVEKTKLYPSVIKDLEEGKLENLNPTYLKGFIKIYASFLGIDTKEFVQEEKVPPKKNEPKKNNNIIFDLLKLYKIFWKIVLFILVFIFLFILILKINKLKTKKVQTEDIQEQLKLLDIKKGEITVALTAKRNCHLRVKIDGKIFFDGIIKEKDKEIWKADKEIELSISDGSSVYIEVNGQPLPVLTSIPKKIKSLKINHTGIYIEK